MLPDEPITTTDETDADTGELYAGADGETDDGYLPDAALDLVLDRKIDLGGNALAVHVRLLRHGMYGATLLISFTSSSDG